MADDRNIAQSAIEVLKNLRGSGAPLAARANDIINNLLGPHLGRSVAPVGALADVASMGADIRDTMEFSGDTVDSLRAGDYGKAASDALYTAAAPLGIVLPGNLGALRSATGKARATITGGDVDPSMPAKLQSPSISSGFDDAGGGATMGLGSGGRTVPPGGVSSEVPQPLPTYPQAGKYETKTNPAGKEYPSKVHTPEEAAIAKQVGAAQRDIQAGNYTPYFDVGKRTDVDVANYPGTGAQTTLEEARPKIAKSIETYKSIIKDPEIRKALQKAFDDGALINNSENWYFVGQLEKEFIEALGEKAGRAAFLEKFVKPMAATTAKATPTSNFRMAMYGNYIKENNLQFPDASYDVPYPVGGFGVIGNLKQHKALVPGEFFSAKQNPKRHNFARNYLGDKSVSTIDAQMTEVMSGGKLQQPKGPSYANYERAIGEQSKKIGVEPRFFQEVAWAGAKQAKEGKKYPGSQPMIEIINQSIERTSRITGLSPKEVVRLGIIESKIPMYALAGVGVAGAMGSPSLSQQDGFGYGALGSVAEESNGQSSN